MTDAPKPRRPKGSGAVARRADGTWIARVELPRDPSTGKRRQKVVRAEDYHHVTREETRTWRPSM